MKIDFSPQSLDDLTGLGYHLEKSSQAAAERLKLAFIETSYGLLEFPEAYAVYDLSPFREMKLRKVAIKGFPNHLIFYVFNDGLVKIERVLHAARDLPAALDELPEEGD